MTDHNDGDRVLGGSAEGDQQQSAEMASLRADVGSLTGQVSQLTALVTALLESKKEEPAGIEESAADRSNALESAAAGSAYAGEGASLQRGTAQDETDLREPHRGPGPFGRHSGEAGGLNPLEVRVAAALNQGGHGSTARGGATAGLGTSTGNYDYEYHCVRYNSPELKGQDFNEWLDDFLFKAKSTNLLEHFNESGTAEIPVNSDASKVSLCQTYRGEQVELAFHAWNFLMHALRDKADRDAAKRAQTPQGALRELKVKYDPESSMQPTVDLESLTSFKIRTGDNPQQCLNKMIEIAARLNAKGLTVNEPFVLQLFVNALPDEFKLTKYALRHTKGALVRQHVVSEVMLEYKTIKDEREKAKAKGAKGREQAYLADGNGRKKRSSGRGRGREHNRRRGDGGHGKGDRGGADTSGDTEESKTAAAAAAADSSGSGDKKYPGRCYKCGHRGHPMNACKTKKEDYIPRCGTCSGWGYTKDKCPSEEAVLAERVD